MVLVLYLYLIIIFVNILVLLASIDHYILTLGMGEADYWAMMFGAISLGVIGVTYYYLFKNVEKYLAEIFGKSEISIRRYS